MEQVPKGRLTTIDELLTGLARNHRETINFPIPTENLSWIAAHATAKVEAEGANQITPYRHALKTKRELNPKFPTNHLFG